MYLAKHVGRWSTSRIGRYDHGRDHSTVCHAINKVERLKATDPKVCALVESLAAKVAESSIRTEGGIHKRALVGLPSLSGRPDWIDER